MNKKSILVIISFAISSLFLAHGALAANPCSVGSGGGSFSAGTYDCGGGNVGGPSASISIPIGQSVVLNNVGSFQASAITGNGGIDQNGGSIAINANNISIGSISVAGGNGGLYRVVRKRYCSYTNEFNAGVGKHGGSVILKAANDVRINSITTSGGSGGQPPSCFNIGRGMITFNSAKGGNAGSVSITGGTVSGSKSVTGIGGNGYRPGNAGSMTIVSQGEVRASWNLRGGSGPGLGGEPTRGTDGSVSITGDPITLGVLGSAGSMTLRGGKVSIRSSSNVNSISITSNKDVTAGTLSAGNVYINANEMKLADINAGGVSLMGGDITFGRISSSGGRAGSYSIRHPMRGKDWTSHHTYYNGGSISLSGSSVTGTSVTVAGSVGGSLNLAGADNIKIGSIRTVSNYCNRPCGRPTHVRMKSSICIGSGCGGSISGGFTTTNVYSPPTTISAQVTTKQFFGITKDKSGNPLQQGSVEFNIRDASSSVWGPFSFNGIVSNGAFNRTLGQTNELELVPGNDYSVNVRISNSTTFTCNAPAICETFAVSFKG